MKRILCFICAVLLAGCDLRQHIVDAPNNIGDFIATKYPALLAEPDSEIYEYASVLDYGNSNTADLYGTGGSPSEYGNVSDYLAYSDSGDYLRYSKAEDYILPDQSVIASQTISDVSKDYGTLIVAEKKSFVLNTKTHKVEKGDTAYSIAKKYNMPLARLAVLNGLKEPYGLKLGMNLKVESAEIITTKTEITRGAPPAPANATPVKPGTAAPVIMKTEPVIKSNAAVKLPKLDARSGTKFAWPVRGNIISDFGKKRNGLTNDGINIAAKLGTNVLAADNGVVAYAGNELKGMGNLLIVQHAGGWMTVYAHLDNFTVRRGIKVRIGDKIGTVGQTGKVSEPQLHFEIRKGSKAYNPKNNMR